MYHNFSVELAKEYGLHEAIILENLHFWIKKNIANGTNYHDGYYWTYNSAKALGELFPYMSNATIRRVLSGLEKAGLIITGNYNRSAYDRTKWYALTEKAFELLGEELPQEGDHPVLSKSELQSEQMEMLKTERTARRGREKSGEPQRKQPQYSMQFLKFWEVYPNKVDKAMAYEKYNARIREGYTDEELITAAVNYARYCRKEDTPKKYIKHAKTFLGPKAPFLEYLEGANEEEAEKTPEAKYSDETVEQFGKMMEAEGW